MLKHLGGLLLLIGLLVDWSFIQAAVPARKLRLYMDWYPNVEFAGIYAALEKGWYRDSGIDLDLIFKDLEIIPHVIRGDADIGMDSGQDLIRHAGKGAPIQAFAAQYQLNPNCIIVRKDLNLKSLAEIRGKTLGIFAPQDLDMYRVMLGYHGLSLSDVKFKEIHSFKEAELIQLLQRHEVDGFIAWEFNWTVAFSLMGYPVSVFPGYENGFHFYGSVFFAKNDYIQKNQKVLRDFLGVTFRGWREVYGNPDRYAQYIVESKIPAERYLNHSKSLTLRQQIVELKLRKRYLVEGVGEMGMGKTSHAYWQTSLGIARDHGIIPSDSALTVEDLFVPSVWNVPVTHNMNQAPEGLPGVKR